MNYLIISLLIKINLKFLISIKFNFYKFYKFT